MAGFLRIWFILHPWFWFRDQSEFLSRGLGGGSAGRYLIARHSHSPNENRPCFRSGDQTGGCSDLAHWVCSAVPSVEYFTFICMHCIQIYLSFGWKYCSVQPGLALVFCGNMCAVPLAWFSISPHIKVLYACPFSMPNLPFLWIWLLSYRKWLRPPFLSIWKSSIGFVLDFLLDYWGTLSYWYDHRPLSDWYDYDRNFLIEMIELSYRNDRDLVLIWGDGKGIFYPLLSLNLSIIFLVIDTENMKVIFSKRESSLQGIWPFILGSENTLNGIANPRPKTLNLLSFQSDRRFVKKTLLKSI